MAKQFRKVEVNDLDPKRTRLKKYRRVYKGDVIRISRATTKTANEIIQKFGFNKDKKLTFADADLLVVELGQGTNKILPPNQEYGTESIPVVTGAFSSGFSGGFS